MDEALASITMAAKAPPHTAPSAFRFGFFAGLGFCCASILMSCLGVLLVTVVGVGSIAAIGSLLSRSESVEYRPTAAVATHGEAAPTSLATAHR